MDYTAWLKEKGWHLAGDALHPTTAATTVRHRGGTTLTTDGPSAETKGAREGHTLRIPEGNRHRIDLVRAQLVEVVDLSATPLPQPGERCLELVFVDWSYRDSLSDEVRQRCEVQVNRSPSKNKRLDGRYTCTTVRV